MSCFVSFLDSDNVKDNFVRSPAFPFSKFSKIAIHLNFVPELWRLREKGPEANGHCRSKRPLAANDLVNRSGSHTEGSRHSVLRNTHGLKVVLQQNFTRSDGWGHLLLNMIHLMAVGEAPLVTSGMKDRDNANSIRVADFVYKGSCRNGA
jgi:hypothetical protein